MKKLYSPFLPGLLVAILLFSCKKETESKNLPPVANAGKAQKLPGGVTHVELDGSKSTDPDGRIVQYKWLLTEIPDPYMWLGLGIFSQSNKPTTSMGGLVAPGIYVFQLIVIDDKGAVGEAITTVEVVD